MTSKLSMDKYICYFHIPDLKLLITLHRNKSSALDKLLGQLGLFLLDEAIGNVLEYLFTPIACLSKVSNSRILERSVVRLLDFHNRSSKIIGQEVLIDDRL